ncbi:competence protein ComK [Lysinibacillus sp. 54212]|uniref:competence protein ComK n=1 Tax=Lysinibacillus sp. 54212 TaxID=3119829 RepID=UPI002FCA61C1
MKKSTVFYLKHDSAAIIPFTSDYGEIHSVVFNNNQKVEVPLSPKEIIDLNLRRIGTSLRGAKDGAKEVLGSASMHPVVLSIEKGMYWFPSESYNNDSCAWFALRCIQDCEAMDANETVVMLTNGYNVNIEVSKNSFKKRLQNAREFKCIIEERSNQILSDYIDKRTDISIIKDGHRVEYRIENDEEDENDDEK